jgi:ribosomal protein S18 acetylase RimI-like enzyme
MRKQSIVRHISFRQAEPEDAREILDFFRMVRQESPFLLLAPNEGIQTVDDQYKQLLSMKEKQKQVIVLAMDSMKPVGFIGLSRGLFKKNEHSLNMAMAVLESHQNLGIGRALVQAACAWASENNVCRVELSVCVENKMARSLYQKLGFLDEGIKKRSFLLENRLADEYIMALMLDVDVSYPVPGSDG